MTPAPLDKGTDHISYRVVPGQDEGWDVVLECQQHVVSSTHCSDWHRVERLCATLNRQETEAATTATAAHA